MDICDTRGITSACHPVDKGNVSVITSAPIPFKSKNGNGPCRWKYPRCQLVFPGRGPSKRAPLLLKFFIYVFAIEIEPFSNTIRLNKLDSTYRYVKMPQPFRLDRRQPCEKRLIHYVLYN